MKRKTRNISIAEYFLVLQKEYLIADFRRKIYYNPKDKAYYRKVMHYKKEKIDNIAARNHLDSIFTNESKLEELKSELFDEFGVPKFDMTVKDLRNYYAFGNEFSYKGEIWVLNRVIGNKLELFSAKENKIIEVDRKYTCRIL